SSRARSRRSRPAQLAEKSVAPAWFTLARAPVRPTTNVESWSPRACGCLAGPLEHAGYGNLKVPHSQRTDLVRASQSPMSGLWVDREDGVHHLLRNRLDARVRGIHCQFPSRS